MLAPWALGMLPPVQGPGAPVTGGWASHLPGEEGADSVRPQAPGRGCVVSATCPPEPLDAARPPRLWPWHCSHQPWSCLPGRPCGKESPGGRPLPSCPGSLFLFHLDASSPPSVGIGRAGASTRVSLSLAAPPPQPGPAPAPACSGAHLCASLLSFPWVWACCPEHPRPRHGLLPAQSF